MLTRFKSSRPDYPLKRPFLLERRTAYPVDVFALHGCGLRSIGVESRCRAVRWLNLCRKRTERTIP